MIAPPSIPPAPQSDYAALRALMVQHGLLQRRPVRNIIKIILTLCIFLASLLLLIVAQNIFLLVLSAAFLAFAYGQIGLLGHDAGHRQLFVNPRRDRLIGNACSFLIGASHDQWNEKHNEHHAHPNRDDMDPDIDFPVLAFSEKQALEKRGFARFIVRHQGVLFFPMLSLASVSLRINAIRFFLSKPLRQTWIDLLLFIGHFAVYFSMVFWIFSPLEAAAFIVLHQLMFGLYLGLIFAPNHKGMPILEKDAKIDFVREQVLTSRNVRSNPLIDFWYGGLNFQIEHHLFPTMPRMNLARARRIVKEFCAQKSIPYYETGVFRSYYEIIAYMHHISLFCRNPRVTG